MTARSYPPVQEQDIVTMDALYRTCARDLSGCFHALVASVPPPERVPFGKRGFVFRYAEKLPEQAIILKLARLLSALRSAVALQSLGQLQDCGAIQRIIDELNEDIAFLSYACVDGTLTPLHQNFLKFFWEEEFDSPDEPMNSSQRRGMVGRERIRAYLSNREETRKAVNPARQSRTTRMLAKGYGGYVHGAAPHIMEMYGGAPPRFHLNGMRGTPLWDDSFHDLKNYWLRSICTFGIAAAAFGSEELRQNMIQLRDHFDEVAQMGT